MDATITSATLSENTTDSGGTNAPGMNRTSASVNARDSSRSEVLSSAPNADRSNTGAESPLTPAIGALHADVKGGRSGQENEYDPFENFDHKAKQRGDILP